MAYDAGKPALALRRNMKSVARQLLAVHAAGQELSREVTAIGIDYKLAQGTSYPVDTDADAFVTLLNNSILSFLQTNAAIITKAADLGDNIQ
jgi:hypothetical protein